ncbi:hypothetical protein ACWX0K_15085 [Nitrobacteraceae bacterium UC4446_H13]
MTRDEAIAKIEPIIADAFPQVPLHRVPALAASEVDMFVALGILKLDEPKAVEQRAMEIAQRHVTPDQARNRRRRHAQ